MKLGYTFVFLLVTFEIVSCIFMDKVDPPCSSLQPLRKRSPSGQETVPNEFPWQAFINVTYLNGVFHVCGGTLISDDWVLSAAHCIYRVVNITITLGMHDLSTDSRDASRQVFYVDPSSVTSYPNWSYPDLEGDVALIKLSSKALINNYVRPISLPYSDDTSFEGEPVILTGWGIFTNYTNPPFSPTLRKTTTFVLSSQGENPECQYQANESFDGALIICGDGSTMQQFCSGDDGGPMNYYRVNEADWVVVGVATWGISTPECASSIKPNLYSRVTNYLDWIHNTTNIPPRGRPSSTTTVASTIDQTEVPPISFCRDKPDGYYPIPGDECTKYFIHCRGGTLYIMECRENDTVFDVAHCMCDYTHNVPGCSSYTASPLLPWAK